PARRLVPSCHRKAPGSGRAVPGNGFPPHKRPKSSGAAGPDEGPGDPFGDNDDFTADDLEEIDILASQALSQEAWGAVGASSAERRAAAGLPRAGAAAAGTKLAGGCAAAGLSRGSPPPRQCGARPDGRVSGDAVVAVTWVPEAALHCQAVWGNVCYLSGRCFGLSHRAAEPHGGMLGAQRAA
uniref:Uncharacterized protein n=1 Tax=Otus sunia TaxID=257818 RepID=A0A8C8AEF8_9STRI